MSLNAKIKQQKQEHCLKVSARRGCFFFKQFGIDFGLKLTSRDGGGGHLQKILATRYAYGSQTRGLQHYVSQTRQ